MFCKALFLCIPAVFSIPLYGTALDDYVAALDPAYQYSQQGPGAFDWGTGTYTYTLDLRSQHWRNGAEVQYNQVEWKHWVTVVIPLLPSKTTALILINGGNTLDPAPAVDNQLRQLAGGTGSIVADLTAVPNQPIHFLDESFSRTEDEIIAYSWDKYLRGGDDFWPLQLPMVKSVVACIDAVQSFAASKGKTVNDFVLVGGSKRGWTAWLTAAVDSRVAAIAPIVIDLLNMQRSFAHHWACHGFWADALWPYEEMGIFDWFDMPRTEDLLAIVDPYQYRDRLTIPKYLIMASGDNFFVSDSAQFYIHDLVGQTYMRIVPNANHYLDGPGIMDSVFLGMAPFYDAFLKNAARPVFDWTIQPNGAIHVQTTTSPKSVKLWRIANTTARDFRLPTTGAGWTSITLAHQGSGLYIGQVPMPPVGWTAFFVELTFPGRKLGDNVYDYIFTTEMMVLPESRPFEADFSRDQQTDLADLLIFSEYWLSENAYRDMFPRRGGDGRVDLADLALFGLHWLEQ